MKKALIIFARNPELGKVKTRLARTMGNEKVLEIYESLLQHTFSISKNTDAAVFVFVAEEKSKEDTKTDLFQNFTTIHQEGADLGSRMLHAFTTIFARGYSDICIIGSDCITLTEDHLEEAFTKLGAYDIVIGPSEDGGYYLLGMKRLHPTLFENKTWSTNKVLSETINDISSLQLSYSFLPVLSDIDTEEDWLHYQNTIQQTNP